MSRSECNGKPALNCECEQGAGLVAELPPEIKALIADKLRDARGFRLGASEAKRQKAAA